ncbi:ComEA family DNA-binding protein [Nocardioides eburneiflavus]|uniref:ComEA family DNA-binding protein n=1 Tax=Nocardioides eburneiflavus TaxID=2518372 RepID=A0A4Z1CFH7_9ACTN|nr:ComEA family DNA-binding protein [Nocardioides eburneiflavus]TGN64945.1 ComEA family DNA-binding protein [Nocardioides eburneiflavus]
MRRSQSSSEHAEAVSRRLATLSAELAAVRGEADEPPDTTHTRVRERPDEPPAPVVLPVPGRHASRRLRIGGFQLGPTHLAIVCCVAALAVGLAAWWAVRDQAEVVPVAPADAGASPAPLAPVGTAADPGADGAAEADPPTEELVVDVAGKVRRPGIAVLPPGSRVVDALEAAGGARRGVDLTSLNLARPVVDGEQILVGVEAAAGVAGSLGSTVPGGETLVNLNTADLAALDTLPGVGPVTAESIIGWRDANGGFTSVDELLEVDGIGEATLADLAPHVTL